MQRTLLECSYRAVNRQTHRGFMYDPKSSKLKRINELLRLARLRSREGHLDFARQLLEMTSLWVTNDYRPTDYLATGLYRRDLSWSQKREFVGNQKYKRMIRRVNDKRHEYVAYNKMLADGLLHIFNIPTPKFHGFVNNSTGLTCDGRPLRSCDDLAALLRRLGDNAVCFKLVEGWGGQGFLKVSPDLSKDPIDVRIHPNGTVATLGELWNDRLYANGDSGYLCQDAVEQHPDTAIFNPTSVNTTRVWIYQPKRAVWAIFSAVFRMGVGQSTTDNVQSGGLTAPVDIETGRLGPALDETVERPIYEVHPTTGTPIAGSVVPDWSEIAPVCARVGMALPFLKLVGLDLAFGVDGPVVLEIEAWPDEDQIGFDRGVRSLLRQLS